jgi:hypothetical protein
MTTLDTVAPDDGICDSEEVVDPAWGVLVADVDSTVPET